ncbi:MAG TPA: T9SS type A sorting domain-containing protein, partial [Saprospiraceae bacterium]|nr:T9SS type A sorting domain-containing protein [Saprospiraceae bacterium]
QPAATNPVAYLEGKKNTLHAYPQPADQQVRLVWPDEDDSDWPPRLHVWAADGRSLPTHASRSGAQEWTLNTAHWPTGVYLLRVELGAHVYWAKIAVAH